jgi:hypothetical protein
VKISNFNYFNNGTTLAMNRTSKSEMDKETKELSYEDARDAAVKSHVQAFPLSLCSPDCIRSQLDNYHKKSAKCNDDSTLKYVRIGPSDTGNQKF